MNRIRKGDQVIVIAGRTRARRVTWCACSATKVVVVEHQHRQAPHQAEPAGQARPAA